MLSSRYQNQPLVRRLCALLRAFAAWRFGSKRLGMPWLTIVRALCLAQPLRAACDRCATVRDFPDEPLNMATTILLTTETYYGS